MSFIKKINRLTKVCASSEDDYDTELPFFWFKNKVYVDLVGETNKAKKLDNPDEAGDDLSWATDITSVVSVSAVTPFLKELEVKEFPVVVRFSGQEGGRDSWSDPGFDPEVDLLDINIMPVKGKKLPAKGLLKNHEITDHLEDKLKEYIGYHGERSAWRDSYYYED